jgi:hypothetical protein
MFTENTGVFLWRQRVSALYDHNEGDDFELAEEITRFYIDLHIKSHRV